MTILDKIIQNKKKEVAERKMKTDTTLLEHSVLFERNIFLMSEYLANHEKTGIIAEFKRKSPSKGMINKDATIEEVTTGYFRSGASALSVLTDLTYFGGADQDLMRARELNNIPILRKDFIVDEYQIIESKAIGADTILLIAAALNVKTIRSFTQLARSVGLQVLLEIHEEKELDAINEEVHLVGINNRDLKTFQVDLDRSFNLARMIPDSFVKISESGITSPILIRQLRSAGFKGFLIGESFMRTADPALAFSAFVKQLID